MVAAKSSTLLADQVLFEIALICSIFGAVLGWVQIHNERHRDLRAFLIHRPILAARKIFFGKILARLCLYSATGARSAVVRLHHGGTSAGAFSCAVPMDDGAADHCIFSLRSRFLSSRVVDQHPGGTMVRQPGTWIGRGNHRLADHYPRPGILAGARLLDSGCFNCGNGCMGQLYQQRLL